MKTIDTRNMQAAEIDKLNERIADDRQMLRLQDDSINKLLRICRNNDATIDENRELKETIRELNADRDWWRTSALDTEKTRAHLDIELIECCNMIDEKDAMIDKLKGGAWMLHNEDDRIDALQYGSITGLFNRVKELKGKLIDEEQRSSKAHKLLQDMTSHDWEQSNEITSMKISHGKERKTDRQTIKELETKLANSERQFNELDAVLVRTFALLHVVNGCLRKRDKTIDELESKLHR